MFARNRRWTEHGHAVQIVGSRYEAVLASLVKMVSVSCDIPSRANGPHINALSLVILQVKRSEELLEVRGFFQ